MCCQGRGRPLCRAGPGRASCVSHDRSRIAAIDGGGAERVSTPFACATRRRLDGFSNGSIAHMFTIVRFLPLKNRVMMS